MTAFAWLKGTQTALALTAFVLVTTTLHALLRHFPHGQTKGRPLPRGYLMTVGVFLIFSASLISFGYQVVQYWLMGVDRPIILPLSLRLANNILYLGGGAVFIALTQQGALPFGQTIGLWLSLMGMIVIILAVAA